MHEDFAAIERRLMAMLQPTDDVPMIEVFHQVMDFLSNWAATNPQLVEDIENFRSKAIKVMTAKTEE